MSHLCELSYFILFYRIANFFSLLNLTLTGPSGTSRISLPWWIHLWDTTTIWKSCKSFHLFLITDIKEIYEIWFLCFYVRIITNCGLKFISDDAFSFTRFLHTLWVMNYFKTILSRYLPSSWLNHAGICELISWQSSLGKYLQHCRVPKCEPYNFLLLLRC